MRTWYNPESEMQYEHLFDYFYVMGQCKWHFEKYFEIHYPATLNFVHIFWELFDLT